jgi:hypothetical protein
VAIWRGVVLQEVHDLASQDLYFVTFLSAFFVQEEEKGEDDWETMLLLRCILRWMLALR